MLIKWITFLLSCVWEKKDKLGLTMKRVECQLGTSLFSCWILQYKTFTGTVLLENFQFFWLNTLNHFEIKYVCLRSEEKCWSEIKWVSVSWLNSPMCYAHFLPQNFNQISSIMSRPAAITAVDSTSDINTEDKESFFHLIVMMLLA